MQNFASGSSLKNRFMTKIPLKRFGLSAEIAQTAVFLAQNDYITGQILCVDGGMSI